MAGPHSVSLRVTIADAAFVSVTPAMNLPGPGQTPLAWSLLGPVLLQRARPRTAGRRCAEVARGCATGSSAGGVRAGRPFVLLEVRSVSLRLCMRAVGVDDVVRALATVLRRHRVPAANFVGHSFGTFVVAHMRKLFPETVSSVLLCDPVRRPHPLVHISHAAEPQQFYNTV